MPNTSPVESLLQKEIEIFSKNMFNTIMIKNGIPHFALAVNELVTLKSSESEGIYMSALNAYAPQKIYNEYLDYSLNDLAKLKELRPERKDFDQLTRMINYVKNKLPNIPIPELINSDKNISLYMNYIGYNTQSKIGNTNSKVSLLDIFLKNNDALQQNYETKGFNTLFAQVGSTNISDIRLITQNFGNYLKAKFEKILKIRELEKTLPNGILSRKSKEIICKNFNIEMNVLAPFIEQKHDGTNIPEEYNWTNADVIQALNHYLNNNQSHPLEKYANRDFDKMFLSDTSNTEDYSIIYYLQAFYTAVLIKYKNESFETRTKIIDNIYKTIDEIRGEIANWDKTKDINLLLIEKALKETEIQNIHTELDEINSITEKCFFILSDVKNVGYPKLIEFISLSHDRTFNDGFLSNGKFMIPLKTLFDKHKLIAPNILQAHTTVNFSQSEIKDDFIIKLKIEDVLKKDNGLGLVLKSTKLEDYEKHLILSHYLESEQKLNNMSILRLIGDNDIQGLFLRIILKNSLIRKFFPISISLENLAVIYQEPNVSKPRLNDWLFTNVNLCKFITNIGLFKAIRTLPGIDTHKLDDWLYNPDIFQWLVTDYCIYQDIRTLPEIDVRKLDSTLYDPANFSMLVIDILSFQEIRMLPGIDTKKLDSLFFDPANFIVLVKESNALSKIRRIPGIPIEILNTLIFDNDIHMKFDKKNNIIELSFRNINENKLKHFAIKSFICRPKNPNTEIRYLFDIKDIPNLFNNTNLALALKLHEDLSISKDKMLEILENFKVIYTKITEKMPLMSDNIKTFNIKIQSLQKKVQSEDFSCTAKNFNEFVSDTLTPTMFRRHILRSPELNL